MPMDMSVVGYRTEPVTVTWDSARAILYALGVGAGSEDPQRELKFTTENSVGVAQAVLPTFPMVIGRRVDRPFGDYDRARSLHAEQEIRLHESLPPDGSAEVVAAVDSIQDKGSGALVTFGATFTDPSTGRLLAETRTGSFVRGEGGFGGDRGPSTPWTAPEREPDVVVRQLTSVWQPLLYRLSGDRNPLHSDPEIAARGGFDRPILHGACTYGFVGRALLHGVLDSDVDRFGSMKARFAAPVYPGQELHTSIWRQDDGAVFVTQDETGRTVLGQGLLTERGAG
jgi:acyl dehydratase